VIFTFSPQNYGWVKRASDPISTNNKLDYLLHLLCELPKGTWYWWSDSFSKVLHLLCNSALLDNKWPSCWPNHQSFLFQRNLIYQCLVITEEYHLHELQLRRGRHDGPNGLLLHLDSLWFLVIPCDSLWFLVIPCEDIQHALIRSRLKSHLEPVIRPNQNGFREGSSTLSQLLSLEELVKRLKKKTSNRKDTKIFIDFQKAFDSTDRF